MQLLSVDTDGSRMDVKILGNNSIVYMRLYIRDIRSKQHLNSVSGLGQDYTFSDI